MEFRAAYGDNLTDPAIVTSLYRNVLGREPDAGGLTFWQDALKKGIPLPQILVAFSESAENKSATATQVTGGITFKEEGVVYSGAKAPQATVTLSLSGQASVGSKLIIKPDATTSVSAQASYAWSLMSKPATSGTQVNATTSELSFTPDVPGTYQIGLLISDNGKKLNGAVQVTVTEKRLLNQPYLAKNGMTVTVESLAIIDHGSNYVDYVVTYIQTNKTNLAIDEGALKLYFQKAAAMAQYGFFNKVYPGDSLRRTYTFTQLKSEAPTVLEYDQDNFFRVAPASDSLQWPVPLN
jgi:hypothetical protein